MRIKAIILKEFIHIRRDFRTLVIVIAMPVVMLFLYGFAINMEIQNIELIVVDRDASPASRDLIRKFTASKFFTVHFFDGTPSEYENFFTDRTARMILTIPHDYGRVLKRQPQTPVQVLIDASDSNAAQAIRNYTSIIFQELTLEQGMTPPFEVETSIWYNPGLKSAYFFVPGLAALILIMISALLTSIAIVREKETGTMEQILVSPIRPAEIIIGKVVPYIFLAFLDLMIILLISRFAFDVPFIGNLSVLLFSSLIFIFAALSIGLMISTRTDTQQVAMMAALLATMLPTVMLSGFIFPLSSLPAILQFASYAVPARYFMTVIRGVMLKGNGVLELWPELTVLAGFGFFLLAVSTKRFQTTLQG